MKNPLKELTDTLAAFSGVSLAVWLFDIQITGEYVILAVFLWLTVGFVGIYLGYREGRK